jgi:hypothetical protein
LVVFTLGAGSKKFRLGDHDPAVLTTALAFPDLSGLETPVYGRKA